MMNETEIITYLKENRTKRVAFGSMPEEVKEWCKEHMYEPIFNVYFYDGWCKRKSEICCFYSDVFALLEDYEPKSEFFHCEENPISKVDFKMIEFKKVVKTTENGKVKFVVSYSSNRSRNFDYESKGINTFINSSNIKITENGDTTVYELIEK